MCDRPSINTTCKDYRTACICIVWDETEHSYAHFQQVWRLHYCTLITCPSVTSDACFQATKVSWYQQFSLSRYICIAKYLEPSDSGKFTDYESKKNEWEQYLKFLWVEYKIFIFLLFLYFLTMQNSFSLFLHLCKNVWWWWWLDQFSKHPLGTTKSWVRVCTHVEIPLNWQGASC